ncbi:MAG: hypothetical protein JWL61_1590 [Gemmatimonadetes bacterium]|nr:hypothetical protein [Gemmatimonadota bacterium]
MIIGHVGVAFAAKSRWPRIPLNALLVATFAPDILRELLGALSLSPWEATLYSHALPWSALLAAFAGALAWVALRDRTAFIVVFGIVLSHVLLDLISGNKPLWYGGPRGIHLGMVEPVELIIETLIMLAGWYRLRRNAAPSWLKHWAVPALLVVVQMASVVGSISQRPYATRCLVSPMGTCSGSSLLTKSWETKPFW